MMKLKKPIIINSVTNFCTGVVGQRGSGAAGGERDREREGEGGRERGRDKLAEDGRYGLFENEHKSGVPKNGLRGP
jgi:hypothetical protein